MMDERPELTGKKALVMGASGDLGEAIVAALAAAGADVGITTASNEADEAFGLRRLRKRVTDLGRNAVAESIDMTIGTGVQVGLRQIVKELGGLDLLVVAPDLHLNRPAERLGDAEWTRMLNTNLSAVFYACRAAYREFRSNQPPGGRIVVLTSAFDEDVAPGEAAYVASKAGLEALARGLAQEWQDEGILVNALALSSDLDEEDRAETAAALVMWLAGPEAATVTGQVVIASPG